MLPRFETLHRLRPVSLVAPAWPGTVCLALTGDALADEALTAEGVAVPATGPSVALEVVLGPGSSAPHPAPERGTESRPSAPDVVEPVIHLAGWRLAGWVEPDTGRTGLTLTPPAGDPIRLRSRRHGRATGAVARVGLTLTGPWLSVLVHDGEAWRVHARADLREPEGAPDPHDPAVLADARIGLAHGGRATTLRAGGFGQLGLRDVRLVTRADGTPLREGSRLWLTATHAGPGFADAAHAGVWLLDPRTGEVEHTGDLFVRRRSSRRPLAGPGVHGDHAVHLVADGDGWLVAAATWDELGRDPRKAPPPAGAVRNVLARSAEDPRRGRHVLDAEPLPLPVGADALGSWDAHLLRDTGPDRDRWLVAFVVATAWFRFHPAVAEGPDLQHLTLRAADPSRVATEGVTLARLPDPGAAGVAAGVAGGPDLVRVLASDGPDSPRSIRCQYPVLDLDLRPLETLAAPYPTNIPWPSVVADGDRWWLVTFDGTAQGGPLAGYGTHGDLLVARSV